MGPTIIRNFIDSKFFLKFLNHGIWNLKILNNDIKIGDVVLANKDNK